MRKTYVIAEVKPSLKVIHDTATRNQPAARHAEGYHVWRCNYYHHKPPQEHDDFMCLEAEASIAKLQSVGVNVKLRTDNIAYGASIEKTA